MKTLQDLKEAKEKLYWEKFRDIEAIRHVTKREVQIFKELAVLEAEGFDVANAMTPMFNGHSFALVRVKASELPKLRAIYGKCKIKSAFDIVSVGDCLVDCGVDVGDSEVTFITTRQLSPDDKCKIVPRPMSHTIACEI